MTPALASRLLRHSGKIELLRAAVFAPLAAVFAPLIVTLARGFYLGWAGEEWIGPFVVAWFITFALWPVAMALPTREFLRGLDASIEHRSVEAVRNANKRQPPKDPMPA